MAIFGLFKVLLTSTTTLVPQPKITKAITLPLRSRRFGQQATLHLPSSWPYLLVRMDTPAQQIDARALYLKGLRARQKPREAVDFFFRKKHVTSILSCHGLFSKDRSQPSTLRVLGSSKLEVSHPVPHNCLQEAYRELQATVTRERVHRE
jgi:hypothetical protein